MTTLSTHVLDTARGVPAEGVGIRLYALDAVSGDRRLVVSAITNADGRTDGPLAAALDSGTYEIVFAAADYFERIGSDAFFDDVPVRVKLDETVPRYHVPLLLSPWAYSTYRGS